MLLLLFILPENCTGENSEQNAINIKEEQKNKQKNKSNDLIVKFMSYEGGSFGKVAGIVTNFIGFVSL